MNPRQRPEYMMITWVTRHVTTIDDEMTDQWNEWWGSSKETEKKMRKERRDTDNESNFFDRRRRRRDSSQLPHISRLLMPLYLSWVTWHQERDYQKQLLYKSLKPQTIDTLFSMSLSLKYTLFKNCRIQKQEEEFHPKDALKNFLANFRFSLEFSSLAAPSHPTTVSSYTNVPLEYTHFFRSRFSISRRMTRQRSCSSSIHLPQLFFLFFLSFQVTSIQQLNKVDVTLNSFVFSWKLHASHCFVCQVLSQSINNFASLILVSIQYNTFHFLSK
jgi:hypothetical protein